MFDGHQIGGHQLDGYFITDTKFKDIISTFLYFPKSYHKIRIQQSHCHIRTSIVTHATIYIDSTVHLSMTVINTSIIHDPLDSPIVILWL